MKYIIKVNFLFYILSLENICSLVASVAHRLQFIVICKNCNHLQAVVEVIAVCYGIQTGNLHHYIKQNTTKRRFKFDFMLV